MAPPVTLAVPKKEKPLHKIPIPNTPWLRVKTTHGNVFYTHTDKKESVWTVPDEIKDFVEEMDWDKAEEEAMREKEIARLAKEIERDVGLKRKAEDSGTLANPALLESATNTETPPPKKKKRKPAVEEPVDQALDEIVIEAPTDDNNGDAIDDNGEEEGNDGEDDDGSDAFSTSEAEEAWQREMAEGLAKLAEEEGAQAAGENLTTSEEVAKQDEGNEKDGEEGDKDSKPTKAFAVPAQVNLSPEEARALFKVRLSLLHLMNSLFLTKSNSLHQTDPPVREEPLPTRALLICDTSTHNRSSLCAPPFPS